MLHYKSHRLHLKRGGCQALLCDYVSIVDYHGVWWSRAGSIETDRLFSILNRCRDWIELVIQVYKFIYIVNTCNIDV